MVASLSEVNIFNGLSSIIIVLGIKLSPGFNTVLYLIPIILKLWSTLNFNIEIN